MVRTERERIEGGQRAERRVRTRTCCGCGASGERDALLRFALLPLIEGLPTPEGLSSGDDRDAARAVLRPVVDLAGKSFGRGAWVHARRTCLERAASRGFSRSARARVTASANDLARGIAAAATARAESLLSVAVRARKAVIGATAVQAASDDLVLAIVATDATEAATAWRAGRGLLRGSAHSDNEARFGATLPFGSSLLFGTKDSLGAVCNRQVVGVIGITDESIAAAIRDAVVLAQAFADSTELERAERPHP